MKQGLSPSGSQKARRLPLDYRKLFLKESYTADTALCINEKSMGIEITAFDFTELMDIAESFAMPVNKETILLKEYTQNKKFWL